MKFSMYLNRRVFVMIRAAFLCRSLETVDKVMITVHIHYHYLGIVSDWWMTHYSDISIVY